jgi:hypothetical protein
MRFVVAVGRAVGGALLGLGALGACGEAAKPKTAEHAALVKYCKSDGGAQKACECAADKTDELLAGNVISPEMYKALVLEAQGKTEESEAIIEKMDIHQQFSQVTAVGDAKISCAGEAS